VLRNHAIIFNQEVGVQESMFLMKQLLAWTIKIKKQQPPERSKVTTTAKRLLL
jgi:hypothetical protein